MFLGEWEISAFDSNLKAQGMSALYSVFSCEKVLPLVDSEDDYDFGDYMFDPIPMVRGARGGQGNQTVAIRVCRPLNANDTQLDNTLPIEGKESKKKRVCEVKYISVAREEDNNVLSEGGIPEDILAELDKELNGDLVKRRKRSPTSDENVEGETSSDPRVLEVSDGASSAFPGYIDLVVQEEPQQTAMENSPVGDVHETPLEKNRTINNFFGKILRQLAQDSLDGPIQTLNETLQEEDDRSMEDSDSERQNRSKLQRRQALDLLTHIEHEGLQDDLYSGNEILEGPDEIEHDTLDSLNRVYFGDKELLSKLMIDPDELMDLSKNFKNSTNNSTNPGLSFSFEYDDYGEEKNVSSTNDIPFEGVLNPRSIDPRASHSNFRSYYIAAEEIMWDYGVTKPHQLIRPK